MLSLLLGFDKGSLLADSSGPSRGLTLIASISFTSAVGLAFIALAQVAGMHGHGAAHAFYWIGIIAISFPAVYVALSPNVSREERIALVLIMGLACYCVKIIYSPIGFTGFDEFLHWHTALNITEQKHLFGANSLLPVSPLYPGLEIVTTAFASLSGLSIFAAGSIVIGATKAAFLIALFLIGETVTKSSWVASLTCIVFVSTSNFTVFHSLFAYESLGFMLLSLTMLTALRVSEVDDHVHFYLLAGAAVAAALSVTHHMTSYFAAVFLTSLAALEIRRSRRVGLRLAFIACSAIVADLIWWRFTGGTGSYIGPIMVRGIRELWTILGSPGSARVPFTGEDGVEQAFWQKLVGAANVLSICFALAAGFFRSLNLAGVKIGRRSFLVHISWENSGLLLLTLLTLGFPLSVLLRLTQTGWEVGNRLGSFVFLGVCVVAAISIAGLWQDLWAASPQPGALASILTIMVLGGFILGWGPNTINYPYKVGADAQSVEPLGIGAAKWTRRVLGSEHRFAADRTNQLLLAVYGRQTPVTSLQDRADIPNLITRKTFGPSELNTIKQSVVDYILIDLRLTTALPRYGAYFDGGERSNIHAFPPLSMALLKFNALRGGSRPFDSGAIIIYDVRSLRAAS